MEPFSSSTYVNVIADPGTDVAQAYPPRSSPGSPT
jgi:hypothetical protein